jgi:hypothetical protein
MENKELTPVELYLQDSEEQARLKETRENRLVERFGPIKIIKTREWNEVAKYHRSDWAGLLWDHIRNATSSDSNE